LTAARWLAHAGRVTEALMSDKPSAAEDEYFAREEALKLQKIHKEKIAEHDEDAQKKLKELHWMKCPKCGWDLEHIKWRDVDVDKCFHCGVLVLDDGEIEKLAGAEHDESWVSSVFSLFKGGD
jgi:hypothetical protein